MAGRDYIKKDVPDFIICGVQKCGTTSLLKYLSEHKQIRFQPPGTEVHFFDNNTHFEKGKAEFTKHFKPAEENILIGQSTSTYVYDYIPERIYKYTSNTKLIFILRNPADRAYSHYWHAKSKRRESLSFEQALEEEKNRIQKDYFYLINYSYFNTGLYMNMIDSFLKYFRKEQMLFLVLEELVKNPQKEIKKVTDFLKLPPLDTIETAKPFNQTKVGRYKVIETLFNNKITRNSKILYPLYHFNSKYLSKKYPEIKPETKQMLMSRYSENISRLEEYLNKDLNIWKK